MVDIMKKYRKVLIIGESDMVYVKEHIENMLKIDRSIQFTIITFTRNRYVEFYKKNNIRLIEIHYEQDKLNLNYFDRLMIKLLHNRFDYIHIQAVSLNALKLAQMISGDKSKIIATYWGFPKSKSEMISIKPYLKQIYKISFVTESLQNYFVDFYGNGYREKSYCFDFGLGCIDIMTKLSQTVGINHIN